MGCYEEVPWQQVAHSKQKEDELSGTVPVRGRPVAGGASRGANYKWGLLGIGVHFTRRSDRIMSQVYGQLELAHQHQVASCSLAVR